MSEPTAPRPVTARLTTPAQMVASLPVWMGYVPTESLVVVCCHEPRGRVGLTLRVDLPTTRHEAMLVEEVVRRVAHQEPSRVLIAVYTDQADGRARARSEMVDELCAQLEDEIPDLVVTEAVLVRRGRFVSYLCDDHDCCPAEGRPVGEADDDPAVRLLQAEQVLRGQVVQPDRAALERSLAGPQLLASEAARQRCVHASGEHLAAASHGVSAWRERWLVRWADAAARVAVPPAQVDDDEAARLVTSLSDVLLRDTLAAEHEPAHLLPLLADLVRRTPAPFDAPVCTLFAWLTYCEGGGAEVTICLERAVRSDPGYSLAVLLGEVLDGQVPPSTVREVTRAAVPARVTGRRRTRRGA